MKTKNLKLGMKWYYFFKTVRPILAILFTVTFSIQFITNYKYYLHPLLITYFISAIISAILQIVLLLYESKEKKALYKLIKIILTYDIFIIPYQTLINNLHQKFDIALAIVVLSFLLTYFVWYRLNLEYFNKRLNSTFNAVVISDITASKDVDVDIESGAVDVLTPPKKKINISTLSLIVSAILLVFCITFYVRSFSLQKNNSELEKTINSLQTKIDTQQLEINRLKSSNEGQLSQIKSMREKVYFFDTEIVFVVEGYGNFYYTYDQLIEVTAGKGSYTYWVYFKDVAIANGYRAW